jgi:hypothetical protein
MEAERRTLSRERHAGTCKAWLSWFRAEMITNHVAPARRSPPNSHPVECTAFGGEMRRRRQSRGTSYGRLDFNQAIRPFRSLAGMAFFATTSIGVVEIKAMGSKSFNKSYCKI